MATKTWREASLEPARRDQPVSIRMGSWTSADTVDSLTIPTRDQ